MMQPIAYVEFADGAMRPVFQDDHSQYVLADDTEPVYTVFYTFRADSVQRFKLFEGLVEPSRVRPWRKNFTPTVRLREER